MALTESQQETVSALVLAYTEEMERCAKIDGYGDWYFDGSLPHAETKVVRRGVEDHFRKLGHTVKRRQRSASGRNFDGFWVSMDKVI